MSKPPFTALAFSYIRFSTLEQRKGDSLRRQAEAAANWCQRHGVLLDQSRTYRDLGQSAYLGEHRVNADRHALAAFLLLVEQGKVPRGSYLIIESLDRLTREHVQAGLRLCLELLEKGIRIVQLSPVEAIYDDRSDAFTLLMMLMELNRGHAESKRKSDLLYPLWRRKRQQARDDGSILTRQVPGWIEVRGGRLRLIPERAKVVQHIYRLAAAGNGYIRIVRQLVAEKACTFGGRIAYVDESGRRRYRAVGGKYGSGDWRRSYVGRILQDRRAVGEFQPRTQCRADGPPIAGYFPAAVTEAEWRAARIIAKHRRIGNHCRKTHADLLPGVLIDAKDGGRYAAATQNVNGRQVRRLVNVQGATRGTPERSFPVRTLERAIVSLLRQLDVRDVVPAEPKNALQELLDCAGELTTIREQVAMLRTNMEQGIKVAVGTLHAVEAREKDTGRRFVEAQERVTTSPAEAWRTMRRLAAALDATEDQTDARLRLQAALRRVIDRVYLLVTKAGKGRCVAAQIHFLARPQPLLVHVFHHPPWASSAVLRSPGRWWAYVVCDQTSGEQLDLRNPKDAARMELGLVARIRANIAPDVQRCKEIDAFHALAGEEVVPAMSSITAALWSINDKRATLRALVLAKKRASKDVRTQRDHLKSAEEACQALRVRITSSAKERRLGSAKQNVEDSEIRGRIATGETSEEMYNVDP